MSQCESMDSFYHPDQVPSSWCPGCGIGTIVNNLVKATMDPECGDIKIVSGIGCAGKVAEYLTFESHQVLKGDIFERVKEITSSDPEGKVILFLNDADLLMSDASVMKQLQESGSDVLVVFINNLIFCITEKGLIPTSPFVRASFNETAIYDFPKLAKDSNASFVARWTPLRAGWLKESFAEALAMKGLRVIEVLSPCVMFNTNTNRLWDPVDKMKFYSDDVGMELPDNRDRTDLREGGKILVGKFTSSGGD